LSDPRGAATAQQQTYGRARFQTLCILIHSTVAKMDLTDMTHGNREVAELHLQLRQLGSSTREGGHRLTASTGIQSLQRLVFAEEDGRRCSAGECRIQPQLWLWPDSFGRKDTRLKGPGERVCRCGCWAQGYYAGCRKRA